MDEIDISKGQSLGTFLVLFFLDNGFFCKKNEKGNRDQRVASPKGDSHNGPKSHTHKRSRGAVCVYVVELLIRIYFFGHNVKRQYILKENKNFSCTIFKQLL